MNTNKCAASHRWTDGIFGGYVCEVCSARPTADELVEIRAQILADARVKVAITKAQR